MMGDPVKLSVGLPVRNGEKYLEQALQSLLDQSYSDFELIVSDNSSTDRTSSICRFFASRDERVRYFRNETNLGAAANFNRVFHLSSGEYFKWAAHDDVCGKEFLLRCVESLEADPSVILAYPRILWIDEEGNHIQAVPSRLAVTSPKPSIRFGNVMRVPNWCLPIFGVIRRMPLAMTSLMSSVGSDHVVLADLSLHGRFHEVPEALFFHRRHDDRYVNSHQSMTEKAAWWDPASRSTAPMPKWHQFSRYMAAIGRGSLSTGERLACYGHVGRWAMRSAGSLVKDMASLPSVAARRLREPDEPTRSIA
jgi:glycosyltransferase involved in cell wall biosynthesis